MSSKLVFLDIDGTLADERHEVPISAQEACKAARSRGHKLFICTGRSMPKIERGILDLGFDGVISVAGAQADVNGRVLFRHDIAPEAIDAATAYFERHGIGTTSGRARTACTSRAGMRGILNPRGRPCGRTVSSRGTGI